MAINSNKRIAVKWVRDKAKKAYEKETECFICGTQVELELHHTHSITLLLEAWAKRKGYDISTDDGIIAVRDEFIEEHKQELYDEVYTLCNKHHVALHTVYGKIPQPGSESKQEHWINIQKSKVNGTYQKVETLSDTVTKAPASASTFSAFYKKGV
jgi:5-methylcytosine-specific restriction endonuclease McrA